MIAAANPDYWTAVIGLCGAFIVVVAIDLARAERYIRWLNLAFCTPVVIAVGSLNALANQSPPPPTAITIGFGAILFISEFFFLAAAHVVGQPPSPPPGAPAPPAG